MNILYNYTSNKQSIIFYNLIFFCILAIFSISISNCKGDKDQKSSKNKNNNKKNNYSIKYFANIKQDFQGETQYLEPLNNESLTGKSFFKIFLNKQGQVVREEQYDKSKHLKRYSKIFYKNNSKEKVEQYTGDHELVIIYKYDKNNKIAEEIKYTSGEIEHFSIYIYDQSGLLTRENYLTPDKKLKFYKTFKYDNNNNRTQTLLYSANGKFLYSHKEKKIDDEDYSKSDKNHKKINN